ncbi:hypothetical protein D3C79_757630 [compost metagenome]
MRVDHFASAPRGDPGGGEQRYVGIGFDHGDLRLFAGGDHAVGKVIVADAVEHHHIEAADALDVLGPWLIGVRVETGRNQRHHFGLVADDVGHVAVVRVQGDADTQRFTIDGGLGQTGQGHSNEHSQQTTGEGGAKHGASLCQWRCWRVTPAS